MEKQKHQPEVQQQELLPPAATLSEKTSELIAGHLREHPGDVEAIAILYRRHHHEVLTACRAVIRNDEDFAEDAAQEVWVKVQAVISSFRHDATFKTWLHRVCTNVSLNQLRAANNRRSKVQSLDPSELEGPAVELDGQPEVIEEMRHAIDLLPESHRDVMDGRVRGDEYRTLDEVAAHLNLPKTTVTDRWIQACTFVKAQLHLRL